MAANRVGALYYEAILDPRGFSRGVLRVRNDQAVLASAIKDTTDPIDRLEAELHALNRIYDEIAGRDPFEGQEETLDALVAKTFKLSEEIEKIGGKEEEDRQAKAKKALEDKEKLQDQVYKRTLKRNDTLFKQVKSKEDWVAKARARAEKKRRDADAQIEKANKQQVEHAKRIARMQQDEENRKTAAVRQSLAHARRIEKMKEDERRREEQHQRRMQKLQADRTAKRLSQAGSYFMSDIQNKNLKGTKIILADLKKTLGGVSGGLSRMAGNLAQAAGMGPQVQGLARVFGGLGLKVLGVVAAVYAVGKALVSAALAADKFEQRQIKIIAAMQGNEVRAKALTEQMRQYAARTSYSTEQMQDFSAKLLSLGVVASDIPDIAEKLGGIAMGDPEKLKRIAKAYSDVMSKGRLMAQEANQFSEANVPLYQALAEMTGKSRVELMKMIEAGEVSADMVDEALAKANEMLGAEEAMERRQNTIAGQWDEIKASLSETWRIIGGPVQNAMVTLLKVVNWVVKLIESIAKFFEPFLEDLNLAYGGFYNMYVIAEKTYLILTGQYEEMQRQAILEGELEDAKKKRLQQEQELLNTQQKQADNFEEMQQQLADELQGYYDRFNEEEKLAEMQFERMLQEKLMKQEITEEQAEQLRMQREFVQRERERLDLEKERAEEAKKIAEEEKAMQLEVDKEYRKEMERIDKEEQAREEQLYKEAKEREAQIEKDIKDKMGLVDKADSGAGASFEAGSVGEFQMMRQMEMQARKDAQQLLFEQEAAKERRTSNKILSTMLLNMQSDAQQQRDDAQWNYYGT